MSDKPKGGRGKVAPYETTTVRVPLPIKPSVDKLIDDYRQSAIMPIIYAIEKIESKPIPLNDAIIKAQEILKDKKSARVSMQKLLQVIYGENITL